MPKLKSAVLLLVVCLLLGLSSRWFVSPTDYPNSDFFSFWLAGRMLHNHQDPYQASIWVDAHDIYGAEWISDPTFLYPIPLAIFFIPFGLLDLYRAFVLWVWLSQIMLLTSVLLLFPLFGTNRKHYILPITLGILLFRPFLPLMVNGQLTSLFLLMVALTILLWERERWFLGGAVISMLALKPNLGGPMLALIGLYLLFRKQYQGLIGIGMGLATMYILSSLFRPDWILEYLEVLHSKQALTFGYSSTLWGVTALFSRFNIPVTLFGGGLTSAALLVFYLTILGKWKSISPLAAVSLSTILTVLVTPYMWPYDQIILLLPIMVCMAIMMETQVRYLWIAMTFLLIDVVGWILFGISATIQMENPNGLLTLLIFGLFLFTVPKRPNISISRFAN